MKAKTNLEVHMNEIIFDVITKKRDLDIEMYTIYRRETGKDPNNIENVVKWYADVPRETFEVTAEMYAFLKAYASSEFVSDEEPLDFSVSSSILIDIGVIPKKYSKMPLKEFIKIIRLKKESNK